LTQQNEKDVRWAAEVMSAVDAIEDMARKLESYGFKSAAGEARFAALLAETSARAVLDAVETETQIRQLHATMNEGGY